MPDYWGDLDPDSGQSMSSGYFASYHPDPREIWARSRDKLVRTLASLGFPQELGDVVAKHLGSPKAIDRMTAYLLNVKPKKVELVVDEMLSIRNEIDAWKRKKKAEEANAAYNELLLYGFSDENLDTD